MTEPYATGAEGGDGITGKKVWIVGINYAPDQVGIAPYTTQLADHLRSRGAEVAVTTGFPYYPEYKVRPEDRWAITRQEDLEGVSVRRLRHTVPRRMTALRRALHELTFLAHARLRRPPFAPDVIIGITPALSGAVAAALHASRARTPLVVVVQDLVGPGALQSGIAGGKSVSSVAGRLEAWVLKRASQVTVLHAGFVDYARQAGVAGSHLHVVRNWSYAVPPAQDRASVRAALGWRDDQTVVLYGGNMGLKMGLENVIDAGRAAQSRGENILFVLLGDGSQRPQLEEKAHGVSTIQFQDSRFGSGFADVLAAADILLINERPTVSNMSLPSKLAYYFTSGRPVLAAVAGGGTTALEVEMAKAGVVVEPGDPEILLNAVVDLAADEDRCRQMGEAGREYAEREYDKAAILARYEGIIAGAAAQR